MSLLVTVVETGAFSAASRKLGIPLPTVSRKISELEEHLKTRLLVRSTRKLALTDAGAAYLAAARNILEQVGDAERAAAGEYATPKGELVIAVPIVFGRLHVLPVVNDFLATFPDIRVRMVFSDRNANLIDEHIDVAVRIGALPDSSMVATRVGSVRRIVCASPACLATYGTPKTPADLGALPCVTFDMMTPATAWLFSSGGKSGDQTVTILSRLSVSTAEAAIDAAIAGVGLTQVLSYQAANAVKAGKLKIVLAEFEREPIPVSLIHAGQSLLPLKIRSFLEFAAPRLRKSIQAR